MTSDEIRALRAVDLFAGPLPGGWDVGAVGLGFVPVGIEWDDGACATRRAAELPTVQADISDLDPLDYAPCDLLIASPPCQAFSSAGKGGGHKDAPVIYSVMESLAGGVDRRAAVRERMEDARSLLVVEPLRWALALRPARIALEQVPPVLPFWETIAVYLRAVGYRCWTGTLSSEQFGVPQTRARAFLVASLDGPVQPPSPTHQRYVPMQKERDHDTLFDPGPRQRIVFPGEDHLIPWISMAEALGWGDDDKVGFGRRADSDNDGGVLETVEIDGVEYRERDFRDGDEPAFNLTSKARSWKHELGERPAGTLCGHHTPRWAYRSGNQERATVRDGDQPAPTILFGHRMNEAAFVRRERSGDRSEEGFDPAEMPAQALTSKARSWTVTTSNFSAVARDVTGRRTREGSVPYERSCDDPAPTIDTSVQSWKVNGDDGETRPEWTGERPAPTLLSTHRSDIGGLVGHQLPRGEGRNVGGRDWTDGRPSTTVTGDPRIPQPGHKRDRDYPDAPKRQEDAVRITIEEAAVLQGFPWNYPWQGSRTKQFEQVGNAVPPPLAAAVLEAVLA